MCRGIINGYPCGGTNPETGQPEPCDAQNRAYFRPENLVIRGQIAKMVDLSRSYDRTTCSIPTRTATGQTYQDVPPSNTFYVWIERLTQDGIIVGRAGSNEACVPPQRPYFARPPTRRGGT